VVDVFLKFSKENQVKVCKRGHVRENHFNRCEECHRFVSRRYYHSDRKRAHAKVSEWRKNNPKRVRNIALKHMHGITIEQYEQMFHAQSGKCAICMRKQEEVRKIFVVDHDHATGKIRELLCEHCNLILGLYKDNPVWFDSAATYLRKHSNPD
jgi:hypothetical protein